MSAPLPRLQCRHIFHDGRRCGSPALRDQPLCYFHKRSRQPNPHPVYFNVPELEDRSAIRTVITHVLRAMQTNMFNRKDASIFLYALQIAYGTFPREAAIKQELHPPPTVVEMEVDPELGPLAPPAEMQKERDPFVQAMIDNPNALTRLMTAGFFDDDEDDEDEDDDFVPQTKPSPPSDSQHALDDHWQRLMLNPYPATAKTALPAPQAEIPPPQPTCSQEFS